MDALELLKQDHRKVKELFKQVEGVEGDKQKKKIFNQIKSELETHARIEEDIFYPAVQNYDELRDKVLESVEEHKQIKTLLREIDDLATDSEKFEPKLKVLQENVEHHAEEEEEGEMFPKVRKLMTKAELEELGEQLKAAKAKSRAAA